METENKIIMKKTTLICFVVVLFLLFVYIFSTAVNLLLLMFGGLMFSIFFHAISGKIRKWTGWNEKISLVSAIFLVILFWSGVSVFIGATVAQQYSELSSTIPETIDNFRSYLSNSTWGQTIIDNTPPVNESVTTAFSYVQKFFKSTFGFFGDIYVLFFFGIFFMISPEDYKNGVLSLIPGRNKKKASEIIELTGNNLKTWLKAQMFEMLFVFTLTAIGLLILGINLWLILAIIAGILTFIPNIGPTLALIPAALVGLLDGPDTALYIIGIFLLVQTVESAVFAPYVQKNMMSLAPALVLFFQFFLGAVTGAFGLLFATPILIVIVNLVNEIYVKMILKQETVNEARE